MKLTMMTSVLLPAAFLGGCVAVPAGSDAYPGAPAYYTSAPADYAVPGYYGAPAYYGSPVYYEPSFGVSVYGGSRNGGWQREHTARGARWQDNQTSHIVAAPASNPYSPRLRENQTSRAVAAPASTPYPARVQESRASRGIAPQATRGSRGTGQRGRAHDRG